MQMGVFCIVFNQASRETKNLLSSAHYCCSRGGKKMQEAEQKTPEKIVLHPPFAVRRSLACREHLVKPALCGCAYVTLQNRK